MPASAVEVESAVRQWLERIVIDLGLCPFAARPFQENRVRICVSTAADEVELLTELQLELTRLSETPVRELETTIIAIPAMLADFSDYNDFLDRVDDLLREFEWDGEFQVASFHPQYQFADTQPNDAENLTNRAPYPLLHLLREASVETALNSHPDPDRIPQDNIERMRALSTAQRRELFGGL